ncbi:hypothetical protein C9374_009280 [Naegleria lovaniensis]|uniref:HMG box domain-containing protein n=1 Tax=Naegleria lovaniensis TaxID=51637 RepID=A0AA88KK14_NAELO|nr:uncharacterized protein C9374_009280 [Naegleria lovaniensis]KAG2377369.1 hypothetical protein C9374_009280 [Naegleria lovaniensis]
MLSRRLLFSVVCKPQQFSLFASQAASYHTIRSLNAADQASAAPKFNVEMLLKEQKEKQRLKELEKKLQREQAAKLKAQRQKSKERLALAAQKQAEKQKQANMRKKDPNAPKRALTPLLWYTTRNFVAVQNELTQNGTITTETQSKFTVVQRELKKRWDALGEEEKSAYVDLAAQDKARYHREMGAYKRRKQANRRPISSYLRFYNDVRETLKKEFPDAKVTELSKVAGQRWRELDAKSKQKYVDEYQEEMERWEEEHGEKMY